MAYRYLQMELLSFISLGFHEYFSLERKLKTEEKKTDKKRFHPTSLHTSKKATDKYSQVSGTRKIHKQSLQMRGDYRYSLYLYSFCCLFVFLSFYLVFLGVIKPKIVKSRHFINIIMTGTLNNGHCRSMFSHILYLKKTYPN